MACSPPHSDVSCRKVHEKDTHPVIGCLLSSPFMRQRSNAWVFALHNSRDRRAHSSRSHPIRNSDLSAAVIGRTCSRRRIVRFDGDLTRVGQLAGFHLKPIEYFSALGTAPTSHHYPVPPRSLCLCVKRCCDDERRVLGRRRVRVWGRSRYSPTISCA